MPRSNREKRSGEGKLVDMFVGWLDEIIRDIFRSSIVCNFRNGWGQAIGAFGISYFIGAKVHSGRVAKKLKLKHLKDQKTLYTQYYNDVYKLEEQKAEQQAVIEQLQAALAW